MSISKRERTLIIIVLILAVLSAYYVFFLKPFMEENSSLEIQRDDKEMQLQTMEQQKYQIDELGKQIDELNSELSQYSENIAQGIDQPPVLVYLEETVNEHAQKLMFAFERPEQAGEMDVIPVKITMFSTYEGLKNLLQDFNDDNTVIRVTSVSATIYGGTYEDTSSPDPVSEDDSVLTDPNALAEEMIEETIAAIEEIDNAASVGVESVIELTPEFDNALQVTLEIDVLSLAGEIPPDTVYEFDDASYTYGGDVFY